MKRLTVYPLTIPTELAGIFRGIAISNTGAVIVQWAHPVIIDQMVAGENIELIWCPLVLGSDQLAIQARVPDTEGKDDV